MQLLGINIYKETPKAVRKVLTPGWYPFGDYKKPGKGRPVRVKTGWKQTAAYQVYQREGLPEITVNCVVGMNGAGKSTLHQQHGCSSFGQEGADAMQTGRSLSYARGLYADFFFLCEGKQYRISCRSVQHEALDEQTCLVFFCLLAADAGQTPGECVI